MPKITDIKIQKNNKTRANVYVDGEFAFGLEMVTVMKLGLKTGSEVSPEKLGEAVFDSEKSVAFERAVNYLSKSMKTEKQVRDYLRKKEYPQEIIDHVLEKLVGYNYVNDELYAETYAEQSGKSKGNRRIRRELLNKGISRETSERFAVDNETSEKVCFSLAEKYMKNKPRDVKTAQKLQRFLLYRGFDYETVNAAVRSFTDQTEGEDI